MQFKFKVSWIGFWFNIPGVTADPTQVVRNFFDTGYDVVLSGIDTNEALIVASQKRKEGKNVYALPYDFIGSCDSAPEACLGVPYYNWGPDYTRIAKSVMNDSWKQAWTWSNPNWKDINNADSSAIGFVTGAALSETNRAAPERLHRRSRQRQTQPVQRPAQLPGRYSVYLKTGEIATDKQIWYLKQLLQGMEGASK